MQAILETKLYRPRLTGDYVPRSRLAAQLEWGLAGRFITLVSAPAGYGKTTAVVAWLEGMTHAPDAPAVAWYSLDETDDNLSVFVRYLSAAVELAAPGTLADLGELLAGPIPLPPVAQIVALLARDCSRLARRLILVLDDYHTIGNDDIHQFVSQLARYLPGNLHLIITSRVDPPLPLNVWRARARLLELRAEDLAFTPDEAVAFVQAGAGPDVPAATALVLRERTEGWAVGLRLATVALRDHANREEFLDGFRQYGHYHIAAYLVDEVLNRLPPEQHIFLLHTSILDRMHRDLCAAVLATDDTASCQRGLEFMERANLFLVALDTRHEWYRYHHQFQAMLRQRLHGRLPEREIAALHRRAADWYASHDYIDDALYHYQAAGEIAAALDLVERIVPALENEERWDRLRVILQRLPADRVQQRPALLLAAAWISLFLIDEATLGPLLERARALLWGDVVSYDDARLAELRGEWHTLRSASYFKEPAESCLVHIREALAMVPASHHWVRAYAFSTWVYAAKTAEERAAFASHISAELESAPNILHAYEVRLLQVLGFSQFRTGSLAELERTCQRYSELAQRHRMLSTWIYGQSSIGMARYYANDLRSAADYLEIVYDHPHVVGRELLLSAAYPLVTIYQATGQPERAQGLLTLLGETLEGHRNREELDAINALSRLLAGDLAAAVAWANGAPHTAALWPVEVRALVLARVRLAEGRPPGLVQAAERLDSYLAALEETGERRQRIHALLLRAQLHWERGETRAAMQRLAEAIEMGYARGYRRWYVEQGPVMGQMLHELARQGRLVEEAGILLSLLAASSEKPRPSPPPDAAAETAIEPLSEREMDVLEYIAAGLSNKQIALKLNISPLTVRNHASNLYAKLNVSSRRQAVARARSLGLLP